MWPNKPTPREMPPKGWSGCTFLAMFLVASGCTTVFESVEADHTSRQAQANCEESAGKYYLPKAVLNFAIDESKSSNGGRVRYDLVSANIAAVDEPPVEIQIKTDNRQSFCLAYNSSIFSEDNIGVLTDRKTGLLKRVYSKVKDKGGDVAQEFIVAGGSLAASLGVGLPSPGRSAELIAGINNGEITTRKRFLQVDPFDQKDLIETNKSLEPLGYCIHLSTKSDPFVPEWMDLQCGQRIALDRPIYKGGHYSGLSILGKPSLAAKQARGGILYKPLLTHKLVIKHKSDPTSSQPWKTLRTLRVKMPNAAPPFALDVKRGLFTERLTDIRFANGLLLDVHVDKKSELNAFIDIPVRAVQVAVEVPTKSLTIATDEQTNQAALIDTNQKMIDTIKQIEKSKEEQSKLVSGATTEQITLVNSKGGVPGVSFDRNSNPNAALSFDACMRNAILLDPTTAEDKCRRASGN